MRKYARLDANHNEIVKAFRGLGWSVQSTATIGDGFPDICIGKTINNRRITAIIEIKDGSKPPSARKLTPDEAEFHSKWKGQIDIIESVEDVIEFNKHHCACN